MPRAKLQWVMMARGIAVAKIRTQSARARVTRKMPDGGLLGALEIAGEEQRRDADPAHQVAEGELQERQVSPGGDAGDRDDGEGARLGGDDRQHDRPPR